MPALKPTLDKEREENEKLKEKHKKIGKDIGAEMEGKYQRDEARYYKKTVPLTPEEEKHRSTVRDREPVEFANDLNNLADYLEKYGDEIMPSIDYWESWFLFDKERPTPRGVGNRTKIQFTIRKTTNTLWREFVHMFSGTPVTKGRGISSAVAELALLILIAIVAEFKVSETGYKLNSVLNSPLAKENARKNLLRLADSIEIAP